MGWFCRIITVFFVFVFFFLLFPNPAFAATTPFRSASVITTVGTPEFTNLNNCSVTDGLTCDKADYFYMSSLFFKDFGTYADFGMPEGSKVTRVRIRVTGKASVQIRFSLLRGTYDERDCRWWTFNDWRVTQFNNSTINTQTFVTDLGVDSEFSQLNYCLSAFSVNNNYVRWRISYYDYPHNWSANIDNFEIAFDYDTPVIPTPSPTPIPTSTPTPILIPTPSPFLDLPWDYGGKGLSFNEAALSINAFFDHEYPLLSSGLGEPTESRNSAVFYRGGSRDFNRDYSSHDGYDYGKRAQANIGDPVLAAASGIATYVNSCSACGNMIVIDHGNGYQTRYLHLQKDELISLIPGKKVSVSARQKIGQVGATGNVFPSGDMGAHIHFGVFEDKNKDGNFEDNIPDGATDPFGWQSKEQDPWSSYTFFYNGQNRMGNKSYYLWTKQLNSLNTVIASSGAVVSNGSYKVEFPKDATDKNLDLSIKSAPIVKEIKEAINSISSIGSTIVITATDSLGNLVTSFNKLFNLSVDFSSFDLSRYSTNTMSIYSSGDGSTWIKEPTIIDLVNHTATAQIDHLTQFALMAQRRDSTPSATTVAFSGLQGKENLFRSDVTATLSAQDNDGGLGVDYIMYKVGKEDWTSYKEPLTFKNEQSYTLQFYSVDKDENIEAVKSVSFRIDKTAPEAKVFIDQDKQDIAVEAVKDKGSLVSIDKQGDLLYVLSDEAGNITRISITNRDRNKKEKFTIGSVQYNQDEPIIKPNNYYNVSYALGIKDKAHIQEERFNMPNENIRLLYDSVKRRTTVVMVRGKLSKSSIIPGALRLLQVYTEKGNLRYRY